MSTFSNLDTFSITVWLICACTGEENNENIIVLLAIMNKRKVVPCVQLCDTSEIFCRVNESVGEKLMRR